ncbi:hypothetical protein CUT44_18140 [Streptomyces carminius]|uniref:GerMN domain-containing protein n=1 Tax=Streptomyces carminius TaxID=2665496 RepID=A0A2M8LWW4_9ACTN|nr:GerMN domain-containing protein [Streptomyces carminius]PJE96424.1 hypothetical protein CUT44_18140 [Streptomyces carminius]
MTHPPARPRRVPRPGAAVLGALAALLAAASAAGCGIAPAGPVPAGAPASGVQRPGTEARLVRLYFADSHGIRAVSRPVERPLGPQQALDLLLAGPTSAERGRGLISRVPPMGGRLTATAADGAVDISVPVTVATGELDVTAVSQLVCTAAHAEVPGDRPPTRVDVRIREGGVHSRTHWTVRCGPNGNAVPVTN